MIYPARVYTSNGLLKKEFTSDELAEEYWEQFQIEESKRYKRSLKFGERTELQKFMALEQFLDTLTNTQEQDE